MASSLLQRRLLQTASRFIQRNISTSGVRCNANPTEESTANRAVQNVFDTHIVEDLHGMTAAEILAETGTRKDSKMRHFTGVFLSSKFVVQPG